MKIFGANDPDQLSVLIHHGQTLEDILEGVDYLKSIGIGEFLAEPNSVSAIEWPEKIGKFLPKGTTKIKIEVLGENKRKIILT